MSALKSLRQIKADGGELVSEWHDGWQLYAYPRKDGSKWQRVQARRGGRRKPGEIRSVNLAWDGESFANSERNERAPVALIEWAADQMREQSGVR